MKSQYKSQSVCYLCSILDEQTKAQRAIVYDSPAATKKVLDVCHAIKSRLMCVYVVTMARGLQKGKRQSFAATAKKVSGMPVLFAQFSPIPLLTYFVSMISTFFLVWHVIKQNNEKLLHLIVYNRNWLYMPSLVLARLLRAKCYLDLEDGANVETAGLFARVNYLLIKFAFDILCCHGSILVTPGLINQVNTKNNIICYGVAKNPSKVYIDKWQTNPVNFLFGGTHFRETGALWLINAVQILNRDFQIYKGSLIIFITGHGPLADELAKFSEAEGKGWIVYKGRVSKSEYKKLLDISHVGLNLRLLTAEMGTTTFPSKVIEMAAQGQLVVTSKLTQVSELLGVQGAYYLEDENPLTLAKTIVNVVSDRVASQKVANAGQQRVLQLCSAEKVADDICLLFSGNMG